MSTYEQIWNMEKKVDMAEDQADFLDGVESYRQSTSLYEWRPKIINGTMWIECIEKQDPNSIPSIVFAYKQTLAIKSVNMFCLYNLVLDTETQTIITPDPKLIDTFGEYCTIIKRPDIFLQRCVEKAKIDYILNEAPKFDSITYVDDTASTVMLGNFKKRAKFAYQQESRFVLDIQGNAGPLCYFNIGSLCMNELTQPVSTTDLVYKTRLTDGHLYVNDSLVF